MVLYGTAGLWISTDLKNKKKKNDIVGNTLLTRAGAEGFDTSRDI